MLKSVKRHQEMFQDYSLTHDLAHWVDYVARFGLDHLIVEEEAQTHELAVYTVVVIFIYFSLYYFVTVVC
jgi:hypothetical protein